MGIAVKGYYNGSAIAISEEDQSSFTIGDEVIVSMLKNSNTYLKDKVIKRKKLLNSDSCVLKTNRTLTDIDSEIESLRSERT